MSFSVNRFTTRAQCAAYLAQKQPERAALLARQAIIQVQIDTWDLKGNPETELATTQASIATMTPLAAAMSPGTSKRRIENMISDLHKKANALTSRSESHGTDELLDREQDRDEAAGDLVILDLLIAAVQTRHDALPA